MMNLRFYILSALFMFPYPAASQQTQDPFSAFILEVCKTATTISTELAITCYILNPPFDPPAFAIISTGNLNGIGAQEDSATTRPFDFSEQQHRDETNDETGGSASADFGQGRWSGIVSMHRASSKRIGTDIENGNEIELTGLVVNTAFRHSRYLVLGGSLSVVENDTTFDNNEGKLESNKYSVSFFANRSFGKRVSAATYLGYAQLSYRNTRIVKVTGFGDQTAGGTALGSPEGNQFASGASLNYTRQFQKGSIRTFVDVNYVKTTIDSYTESGDDDFVMSGLVMDFAEQATFSLTTSAGVQANATNQPIVGVTPFVRLTFVQEHRQDARTTIGILSGADNSSFVIPVEAADSNYIVAGVGASARVRNNDAISFLYQQKLDDSLIDAWAVSVNASVNF